MLALIRSPARRLHRLGGGRSVSQCGIGRALLARSQPRLASLVLASGFERIVKVSQRCARRTAVWRQEWYNDRRKCPRSSIVCDWILFAFIFSLLTGSSCDIKSSEREISNASTGDEIVTMRLSRPQNDPCLDLRPPLGARPPRPHSSSQAPCSLCESYEAIMLTQVVHLRHPAVFRVDQRDHSLEVGAGVVIQHVHVIHAFNLAVLAAIFHELDD